MPEPTRGGEPQTAERRLRVAVYGDDFTGTVDAVLQFARRGLSGRLFVGLPSAAALDEAAGEHEVVAVAGIARSLPATEIAGEVGPVLDAFAALGAPVVQYKACSTADSSPAIGSIGRVLELARERGAGRPVPMLFAQPDFGRYTAFGHHFAREGDRVFRLDRQPTMSTHPSTPMTEADLAEHLRAQTALPIGGVAYIDYRTPEGLAAVIAASDDAGVVLDALDAAHVETVGRAVAALPTPVFAIGSGGLSTGLGAAWGQGPTALPTTTGVGGPVLAISGSRSATSARQLAAARDAGWWTGSLAPAGDAGAAATLAREAIAALRAGRSVAVDTEAVRRGDGDEGGEGAEGAALLPAIAAAATDLIRAVAAAGVTRRLVVLGGDTSSRVIGLAGVESLAIAANPWDNVVLLTANAPAGAIDGWELLLKGGQVGDDDLLVRIERLAG